MRQLYVRFAGDNDFCNTMIAFVKAVAPRILLGEWKDVSKQDIVSLFNQHAFSLYALHQSTEVMADVSVQSYLKIEIKDVYFDDEVASFVDFNHDGCLAYLMYDDETVQYSVM